MPRRSSKDGSSDKSSSRRSSSDGAGSRRSSKEDGGAAGVAGPDELHAASEHHPDRRTGLIWSVNDDHGARLHSVPAASRPLKNCMKVSSLEESLRIADENDRRRKEKRRAEGRTGNFSVIRHMSSRGAGSDKNASGGGGPLKSTRNLIRHMSSRGNDANNAGGGSGGGGFGGFIARGLRSFGGSAKGKDKLDTVSEASSSPKQGSARKKKRAVKFSTLRFRWYDLRADDNPGVSKGPALGIGWKYEEDESDTPVDVHEHYRTSTAPRRRLKEIKLSEQERERRLLESGVTISEIQKMRKQINLAKGRRRRTIEEGLTNMESEERKERVLHKIKKMLKMRKKYEREEEDLWDKAQERDDAPKVVAQ